jgi:hypothetical protein
MLLEKFVKEGDIVTLKLINGEELITRFDEEGPDYVKVTKPLALVAGGKSLGMIPWIFLASSDSFKINKQSIIMGPVLSKLDAAQQYLEGTTGIALS